MAVARVQVILPRDGGMPEDDTVNVFHFLTSEPVADAATDLEVRLLAFYQAFDQFLSPDLSGVIKFKFYDLAGLDNVPPALGPPVAESEFPSVLSITSTDSLPAELAIRLSLTAPSSTGVPIQYRRGGVFLGPLSTQVLFQESVARPDTRVAEGARTAIAGAAATLAQQVPADGHHLVIYSPTWHKGRGATSGGAAGGRGPLPPLPAHPLAESVFTVDGGWVDDAFDVQRRRGATASTRTTFVAT